MADELDDAGHLPDGRFDAIALPIVDGGLRDPQLRCHVMLSEAFIEPRNAQLITDRFDGSGIFEVPWFPGT